MAGQNVVLLVKTEGSMDLQLFLKLCRMAQDAGFVQVQIAGEHVPDASSIMPSNAGVENASSHGFLSEM